MNPSIRDQLRLPLVFALIIGCALEGSPVSAHELYNQGDSVLNADLEAVFAALRSSENYDLVGNRSEGSSSWREGYVKYGLSGSQGLAGSGTLYGALNLVSSGTWGDGDAAGLTQGSERRTAVEDAYLGWHSADLFPWLGNDGVDISGGRQVISLGDGFLIQGDPVSFGDVDLGTDFDRGGAYYLAGRKAFDQTAALRLGGDQGWRGDLIWLKSDNPAQAETELAIGNLEHVDEFGTLGLSWIHGLDVNQRFAQILGREQRDGMDTVSLRGRGGLGVEHLELAGEYVTQENDRGRESAWYLEGSWTFADTPWAPTANYRYSRFSEAFDPLFYGLSRGYGTWYQGEVAGNYAGPFNTNTRVHHIGLKATPQENLTLSALYFDFAPLDPTQSNRGGRELDLSLEWMVNDHLLINPLLGFYKPNRGSDQGGLQLGGDSTNTYLQLVVGTFF